MVLSRFHLRFGSGSDSVNFNTDQELWCYTCIYVPIDHYSITVKPVDLYREYIANLTFVVVTVRYFNCLINIYKCIADNCILIFNQLVIINNILYNITFVSIHWRSIGGYKKNNFDTELYIVVVTVWYE